MAAPHTGSAHPRCQEHRRCCAPQWFERGRRQIRAQRSRIWHLSSRSSSPAMARVEEEEEVEVGEEDGEGSLFKPPSLAAATARRRSGDGGQASERRGGSWPGRRAPSSRLRRRRREGVSRFVLVSLSIASRPPPRVAPRRRLRSLTRSRAPSPSSTVSGRSCSTGRETFVPPVCAQHYGSPPRTDTQCRTTSLPSSAPASPRAGDSRRSSPHLPPPTPPSSPPLGTPSTRPLSEIVVIPCMAVLSAAEEALSSLALVALVSGNRPPVSPAQVREQL